MWVLVFFGGIYNSGGGEDVDWVLIISGCWDFGSLKWYVLMCDMGVLWGDWRWVILCGKEFWW